MSRLPTKPPKARNTRKGGDKFGPPSAINIVRFARSLWPKPEQDGELCQALIEATFKTIAAIPDAELRRSSLRAMLDRAYEELKEP
jgi:hypothetical protein